MRHNILTVVIFCFLSFAFQNPITFAQASFETLGDLPGGDFRSNGFGVSADGSVIVGRGNNANSRPEAFR